MKITILDGYTENPGDLSWAGFEALGELTVYDRTDINDEKLIIGRIADSEAVIVNKTPVTRAVLDSCPGIKYIGVLATGYNVVDTVAASERNIPVVNVPAYGTAAVAQFAVALLLEVACRVGDHGRAVAEGKWEASPDFCFWDYPITELAGKTAGIVGMGRIGGAVGKILDAMGMKVMAYDKNINPEYEKFAEYTDLESLYENSDVISLHCPLFPENTGMINKESIAKMKDGVIIINNSRGQLIDERDMADALNSGKIKAAAVDVVSSEPIKGGNPLLKAKNCIITPHISWASRESRERLMDIAVAGLKAFIDGKPINVVNRL